MKKNIAIVSTALIVALLTLSFQNNSSTVQNANFAYRKMSNSAFKEGEKLKFRAHYGIINAAVITMSVGGSKSNVNGRNCYALKVEGETLKSFDWAYKVRDKFESWLDADALAPLRYAKTVRENKYYDEDLAVYQHDKNKLKATDGTLTMQAYTQDIASALYYARNLDFSAATLNQSYPINIYLDNKIYNLNFTYLGKETLNTDLGKVKCIKLRPKLVVDRVFKSQNDMTVWISDDKNHIPIRVQTAIKVGSIKVDITGYENLKNNFDALVKK